MLVRSTIKWTIILAALLLVGPIAGRFVGSLRGSAGGTDTTPLLSVSIATGLLNAGVAIGLAGLMGIGGARLFGSKTGLTVTGLVLAWAAWSTGSLDALIAQVGPKQVQGMFIRLALEGLIFGLAGLAIAYLIFKAGSDADERILQAKGQSAKYEPDSSAVLMSLIAATALAGLVVWWIAFQPLKGQAIFAVIAGAIAAAAAAHLMAPHLPSRVSAMTAFAAIVILAVAGPVSVFFLKSGGTGLRAAAAGAMSHLAHPVGLDWVAGAFLGIPIGLSWSGSMVEKHTPKPAAA